MSRYTHGQAPHKQHAPINLPTTRDHVNKLAHLQSESDKLINHTLTSRSTRPQYTTHDFTRTLTKRKHTLTRRKRRDELGQICR